MLKDVYQIIVDEKEILKFRDDVLPDQTWIQILRSSLPLGLEKVLTFIPQLIAQWEFSANQQACLEERDPRNDHD